jgi:hypothetical protein
MTAHDLTWSHGTARVLTTAAMLARCRFDLGGRTFAPFAESPWMGMTPRDPGVSAHLYDLGAEFVCQPFGRGRALGPVPDDWAAAIMDEGPGKFHGLAADAEWHVDQAGADAITLSLGYPEPAPVARLVRSIAARPGAPALDLTLTIHARHAARISLGLHPILRLPDAPGRLHLLADFAFGLTHPGQTAPDMTGLFTRLDAVLRPGGTVDMGRLPLSPRTDLNVQLCGVKGPVRAIWRDEAAGLEIDWDRVLLPSVQLWHTDGGISAPPFSGRYRGLGVEPVAAAFDLGDGTARADNPITRRRVPTTLPIAPDRPVTIAYSMAAFAA